MHPLRRVDDDRINEADSRVVPLDAALLHSWPLPIDDGGDKRSRGTVLVIAGSTMTAGAALLAGTAALRMGAGRLQIATAAPVAMGLSIAMPEALVAPLEVDADHRLVADAVAEGLGERVARAQAILIGPGLSGRAAIRAMIDHVATTMSDECVLIADAGALQAIASTDRELVRSLAGRLVLTPNRDELAELVHALAVTGDGEDGGACRVASALGAIVTCFGEITAFDDRRWHAEPATPGLGTSGSGDVLAGLVAGAAARCHDAAQAACWASYVHAMAGNRLSERLGTMSFIARELLDEVPRVLATLD